MSELKVNAITDASGGSAASINGYTPSASNMTGRNRIINGAMMIDQRNAGASVACPSTNPAYATDRTAMYTNAGAGTFTCQQSTDVPAGFKNSLSITATASTTVASGQEFKIFQSIEGYNVADLNFGSASAKTFTVSFWVKSSITGTYSFGLANGDGTRTYGATYAINSANTWEKKTITVAGDTSGTWLTTNGNGLQCNWYLGAGSNFQATAGSWQTRAGSYSSADSVFGGANSAGTQWVQTTGATFYLTGVQLEVGSTASEFEHRQYGQELALCQRYYWESTGTHYGCSYSTGNAFVIDTFPSEMRATPTITVASIGGGGSLVTDYSNRFRMQLYCSDPTVSAVQPAASAEL